MGHDPRADHLRPEPDDTERHGDLGDVPDDRRPGRDLHGLDPGALLDPVLLDHYYPVGHLDRQRQPRLLDVGFGAVIAVGSTGGTAPSLAVSTPNHNATYFGGSVDLSIEGGPEASGVLPTGIGAVSVTPSTITLDKGASHVVSMSIDSGTLAPGAYPLTLRVTGTNSAGQVVTRLTPLTLAVASGTTSDEYIDISDLAVFRITCTPSDGCANVIEGYAITGVYADLNDPGLRRGQVARLVPWN